MRQYGTLTQYISLIEKDEVGSWMSDKTSDKESAQFPHVRYSGTILRFIRDVYTFIKKREDLNLYEYRTVLEKNGIDYSDQSFKDADTSTLEGPCVVALILGVLRADRFVEGMLLHFLEEGYISKWLRRLEEIDSV